MRLTEDEMFELSTLGQIIKKRERFDRRCKVIGVVIGASLVFGYFILSPILIFIKLFN